MRYLLILFFLSSCYGPKTAQKQLSKAYANYPEIVAKNASKLFPCDYSARSTDSSTYFDWQKQAEAINDFYSKAFSADTIIKKDTQTILISKKCDSVIFKYKTLIKSAPAIHDTIKVKDNAEISYLNGQLLAQKIEYAKLDQNFKNSLKASILLLLIIIAFLIYQRIKKW